MDYESLAEAAKEALYEVSQYSIGKVEQVIKQADVNEPVRYAWRRLTKGICYDKEYCRMLGVDYNTLPNDDVHRIQACALMLAKKDPEFVLPIL